MDLALIAPEQFALVAVVAFLASILGGITGYGTGLLLPPVLIPLIGPEAVVPVIGLSALLTNGSRLLAFRDVFDRRRAGLVLLAAAPTCLLGAWGYTRLSGAGVSILIGLMLIVIVPLRRVLMRRHGALGRNGLLGAAAGYGLLSGGTSGAGVVLLSILVAGGLSGSAVVATDAGISLALGLAKTAVFQASGALPPAAWIMAALIGLSAMPGAFLARHLAGYLPARLHTGLLDGVVILGGALLLSRGLAMVWAPV